MKTVTRSNPKKPATRALRASRAAVRKAAEPALELPRFPDRSSGRRATLEIVNRLRDSAA